MFIGKYNKSVILTYLGALAAIMGITMAINNHSTGSIICLIIAGICDLFDGKVARMCKNRTEEDKEFGVQIDSLTDMISFVALPVVISCSLGLNKWYCGLVYGIFTVCGIIRLGFFNLNSNTNGPVKYYKGLPVTSTAFIFPALYLLGYIIKYNSIFKVIFFVAFLIIACLFVLNFKLRKPKKNWWYIFCSSLALIATITLLCLRFCR